VILYAVIFGADSFIQEDTGNFLSFAIPEDSIKHHPNPKVQKWT
jgi:hypothetical protein